MTNGSVRNSVVRPEVPGDTAAIYEVTKNAFRGKTYSDGDEQDLINNLRRNNALTLSLVAEVEGKVIGHITFSPAFAANGPAGWFALGPVAVEPNQQRRGVGTMLIREGLENLRNMNARGCILIGDTGYYVRHGFVPRPDLAPSGEPAAHYMVYKFDNHVADAVVSFHAIFHSPDGHK